MRNRIVLLIAAVASIVFGIATTPALANPAGNYNQPDVYYACGSNYSGHLDVHYNHNSSHNETAYGLYGARDAGTGTLITADVYVSATGALNSWTKVEWTATPYPGNGWGFLLNDAPVPTVATGHVMVYLEVALTNGNLDKCTLGANGAVTYGLP